MNFGELQVLTSTWLDDLNYGYFTQDQVKLWLNLGQNELQKKLLAAGEQFYTNVVCTTTVLSQQDYVLPQDFRILHRLEIVQSGVGATEDKYSLAFVTLNQQDFLSLGPGEPQCYTIKRNRLMLWPFPDNARTLRMYYSYQVTDMINDNDLPDAPDAYHEYIALYAAKSGFLRDDRAPEMINQKLAEYELWIKQDAEQRRQDSPRDIVVTRPYYGGGYWA
jgi:hypothetical protein